MHLTYPNTLLRTVYLGGKSLERIHQGLLFFFFAVCTSLESISHIQYTFLVFVVVLEISFYVFFLDTFFIQKLLEV